MRTYSSGFYQMCTHNDILPAGCTTSGTTIYYKHFCINKRRISCKRYQKYSSSRNYMYLGNTNKTATGIRTSTGNFDHIFKFHGGKIVMSANTSIHKALFSKCLKEYVPSYVENTFTNVSTISCHVKI